MRMPRRMPTRPKLARVAPRTSTGSKKQQGLQLLYVHIYIYNTYICLKTLWPVLKGSRGPHSKLASGLFLSPLPTHTTTHPPTHRRGNVLKHLVPKTVSPDISIYTHTPTNQYLYIYGFKYPCEIFILRPPSGAHWNLGTGDAATTHCHLRECKGGV